MEAEAITLDIRGKKKVPGVIVYCGEGESLRAVFIECRNYTAANMIREEINEGAVSLDVV